MRCLPSPPRYRGHLGSYGGALVGGSLGVTPVATGKAFWGGTSSLSYCLDGLPQIYSVQRKCVVILGHKFHRLHAGLSFLNVCQNLAFQRWNEWHFNEGVSRETWESGWKLGLPQDQSHSWLWPGSLSIGRSPSASPGSWRHPAV